MQTKPRRLCFDLILLLLLLLCCYFSSMADPYGTGGACSPSHSPSSTSLPLESEDISTFLHHLLHNPSSASSSSCMSMKNRHMQSLMSLTTPPLFSSAHESNLTSELFDVKVSPEDRRGMDRFETRFESDCRIRDGNLAAGSSAVVVDSPLSFNFSDPGGYFASDARGDSRENVFSRVGALGTDAITCSAKRRNSQLENDSDGYGYDSEKGHEASDVPANPVPPRSSSKRSRAAEIHNLSEKRRRSRINEKMKALQNLIPNSNKTDKASMLDEAIEYLKQLQLQVQMLSMRNGLSLHPLYIPAGLQSMELPQTGTGFDDRNGLQNTNAGVGPIVADQDPSMRTGFDLSSHCHPSNQPIVMPTLTNITNPETSFGFEPVIEAQYGSFNLSTSSKEICGEDTLPELELDMSCFRKNNSPSPGVS